MTEWKPVVGYEVSDDGQVRSLDRVSVTGRFCLPGKVLERGTEKISGYQYAYLDGKKYRVHVLVATAFIGAPLTGQEVWHLNSVPADNRPTNLAWATRQENVNDMTHAGRHANSQKTHCLRGHEYDSIGRRSNGKTFRVCNKCRRMRDGRIEHG